MDQSGKKVASFLNPKKEYPDQQNQQLDKNENNKTFESENFDDINIVEYLIEELLLKKNIIPQLKEYMENYLEESFKAE